MWVVVVALGLATGLGWAQEPSPPPAPPSATLPPKDPTSTMPMRPGPMMAMPPGGMRIGLPDEWRAMHVGGSCQLSRLSQSPFALASINWISPQQVPPGFPLPPMVMAILLPNVDVAGSLRVTAGELELQAGTQSMSLGSKSGTVVAGDSPDLKSPVEDSTRPRIPAQQGSYFIHDPELEKLIVALADGIPVSLRYQDSAGEEHAVEFNDAGLRVNVAMFNACRTALGGADMVPKDIKGSAVR
jgi:hypothetical protein